jgi:hypothetical protein
LGRRHSHPHVLAVLALAALASGLACSAPTSPLEDTGLDSGPADVDAGPPCWIAGCPGPVCPNGPADYPCWTCDDAGACHAPPDAGGLQVGSSCTVDHECAPTESGRAYCLYSAPGCGTEGVCGPPPIFDDYPPSFTDGGDAYGSFPWGVCDCNGNSHNYGLTDFPWQWNYGGPGEPHPDACTAYDGGVED